MTVSKDDNLHSAIERQSDRKAKFERTPKSFIAQTAFAGMLGLLFILPVVGGAYLGRWIDSFMKGYSLSWTVNLILLGVALGAYNVYLFIRERW
jgi:ATP synthase protein I